jgi:GAF domain-containing protein
VTVAGSLQDRVRECLCADGPAERRAEAVLRCLLEHFGGSVGTIHRLDEGSDQLTLVADVGLPDGVRQTVRCVPVGKGMAGLAAQRREPVSVCNLQTDDSGKARAGARATGMRASIAVPMMGEGRVAGVLGVGRADEHEFTAEETALLMEIGAQVGAALYLSNA